MFPYSPFAFDGDLVLKGWNYVWPLLVFTLGLSSVLEHPAFGGVMMAFGGYEFVRRVLLGYQIATLPAIPWYVILLAMAIVVLLLVLIGKKHLICKAEKDNENADHTPVLDVSQDDNYLDADMSFGSGVVTYDGDTLRGGSIDMNFGDYKVDFRRVRTFTENCLLEIDQNFGSLTIFMPQHVRLVKSSDTSFGSFATYGEPSPDATQSIIIRADVNFGTLQVKYE